MADAEKVELFLSINENKFAPSCLPHIKERLLEMDEDTFRLVCENSYKSPSTMFLVAFFLGHLGIDRFFLGDKKNGLIKLFTIGAFGPWWLYDVISIKRLTRNINYQLISSYFTTPDVQGQ